MRSKMKVIAIIGILVSISSIGFSQNCQQLPWIREFGHNRVSRVHDGRLFTLKSLDSTDTCKIFTRFRLDQNISLTVHAYADSSQSRYFVNRNMGDGVYLRTSLEAGFEQERRIYAHHSDENGAYSCAFTCDGQQIERFDCYASSLCYLDVIDQLIRDSGLELRINQRWVTCRQSPIQSDCGCPEDCSKYVRHHHTQPYGYDSAK